MSLSRHERQFLKRHERDEAQREKEQGQKSQHRRKTLLLSGLGIILLLLAVYFFPSFTSSATRESYTASPVHWHADLQVRLCGRFYELPKPLGEHHLGMPLLHTHEDQRIHIEGRIWKEEEITLGQYMENIGLAFDAIHLIDKENGDGCQDGKENKVRLVANGEDTPALDRYVIRDGDTLLLSYE